MGGWEYCAARLDYGWPMYALSLHYREGLTFPLGAPPYEEAHFTCQIPIGPFDYDGMPHIARLPLRPRPIGFFINTLFYALLVVLPFVGMKRLRYRRRRRAGLCISCRYAVRGLDRCPECGTPVT